MPNEPDNRMDELLKAYAQKRKADAGDSFELHPATRRLLRDEVSKLQKNESQRRPPSFSALLAHWPRVAYAVGLFAVLGLAVWLSLPARQGRSGEQLLAQSEHSRLNDEQAAPKSDVGQPPAEVAQTMRRALQPTNSGKDSDGLRLSPRSFSDEVEERRGAEKGIAQLNENIAFAAAELKKKQAEEAAPGGDSPRLNFRDAQRQSETDLVLDIAARSTPIPAPGQLPAVPAAAGPTVADLNGTAAAAEGAQPGKQLASLRDSMPVPPAPSRAVDEREKLEALVSLGTFTNSRVAVDGAALKSQISNTSQDSERSQIANVAPAAGNIVGRESDRGSNRGYAGNATSSMTVQLRQQDHATVLSKNEAATNLQLNRVASPQSPSFAKDQTGVSADYFAGAAVQNQVAPQIQSSGRIANAPVARVERVDRPGNRERNLALTAEQNLRGPSLQTGKAEDFREAQSEQVVAASVLSSFKLEQSGSRMRVLDSDGSVYEGAVTTAESASSSRNRGSEASVSLQRVQGTTPPQQSTLSSEPQATGKAISGASILSFRVAGTNATFKLPVILEGTVWGESTGDGQGAVTEQFRIMPEQSPAALAEGGGVRPSSGPARFGNFRSTATALRVTGRARIGSTNQVSIDAIRAGK